MRLELDSCFLSSLFSDEFYINIYLRFRRPNERISAKGFVNHNDRESTTCTEDD
jgi:hypothetical protein